MGIWKTYTFVDFHMKLYFIVLNVYWERWIHNPTDNGLIAWLWGCVGYILGLLFANTLYVIFISDKSAAAASCIKNAENLIIAVIRNNAAFLQYRSLVQQ